MTEPRPTRRTARRTSPRGALPAALRIAAAAAIIAVFPAGSGPAPAAAGESNAVLAVQVRAAETAFAKSMADRDPEAFASHVSEEAVFFGHSVLRGRAEVVAGWAGFFEGPAAPFSWEPEQVEVLDSGSLALSSGPVHDPEGKQAGTFTSIWRKEADGVWRVIFDKGCPPCEAPPRQ